jgi:hypothetical protein
MKKPYTEKVLNENTSLRGFSKSVSPNELVWHRDSEKRVILVVEGKGWMFQRDNELPFLIESGDKIAINPKEYHRLIKGKDDLIVAIIKEDCWKGYIQKGMKKKGDRSVPNCVPMNEDEADGMRSVKHGADTNKGVSKMDFLPTKVLKKIAADDKSESVEEDLEEELTPGYKKHRSSGDQSMLQKLIDRYKNAKTEKEKKAARKARDKFEKTQFKSNKQSKHNYKKKKK